MIWERRFKVRLWKSVVEDRGGFEPSGPDPCGNRPARFWGIHIIGVPRAFDGQA